MPNFFATLRVLNSRLELLSRALSEMAWRMACFLLLATIPKRGLLRCWPADDRGVRVSSIWPAELGCACAITRLRRFSGFRLYRCHRHEAAPAGAGAGA